MVLDFGKHRAAQGFGPANRGILLERVKGRTA